MKAKEYYEKYRDRLLAPDSSITALTELIREFAVETRAIMDRRGVKTNKAAVAVLKEMNDKWNAIARMFPVEVLKRNGWREYFMMCLEEEEKRLEEEEKRND